MPRKRYSTSKHERYEVSKTGDKETDAQAEKVIELLNKGAKLSAFRLAVYYGLPWLISIAAYACGLGYLAYHGLSIN